MLLGVTEEADGVSRVAKPLLYTMSKAKVIDVRLHIYGLSRDIHCFNHQDLLSLPGIAVNLTEKVSIVHASPGDQPHRIR